MNQKIKPDQVGLMMERGFRILDIAKRLNISTRQVSRIIAKHGFKPKGLPCGHAEISDLEVYLWMVDYRRFESLRKVAYAWGVSHETVRQAFEDLAWAEYLRRKCEKEPRDYKDFTKLK